MILATQPFDPTEPEDRRRSSHITRKEVIVILVVVIVLAIVLWPVYNKFKLQRDKHLCKDNLLQISRGLLLYAEENTGRLPPLYVAGENFEPRMFKGRANSWMSLISPGVRKPETTFTCPSAHEDELAPNEAPGGATIYSAYGKYGAMAAAPLEHVPSVATQVLVAETSNQGARGTYNPKPFKDASGKPVPDGYVIGLDNSNFQPDDSDMSAFFQSKLATRLAFYGSASGEFDPRKRARHPGGARILRSDGTTETVDGIHVLFADGHVETVTAPFAHVSRAPNSREIVKAWQLR